MNLKEDPDKMTIIESVFYNYLFFIDLILIILLSTIWLLSCVCLNTFSATKIGSNRILYFNKFHSYLVYYLLQIVSLLIIISFIVSNDNRIFQKKIDQLYISKEEEKINKFKYFIYYVFLIINISFLLQPVICLIIK